MCTLYKRVRILHSFPKYRRRPRTWLTGERVLNSNLADQLFEKVRQKCILVM